jgi:hypothetical protein
MLALYTAQNRWVVQQYRQARWSYGEAMSGDSIMSNRRVESFLLRLVVHENEAPAADAWRGRIQHISSGYERQFERMQDLLDFIGEQLVSERSVSIVCDEQLSAEQPAP